MVNLYGHIILLVLKIQTHALELWLIYDDNRLFRAKNPFTRAEPRPNDGE